MNKKKWYNFLSLSFSTKLIVVFIFFTVFGTISHEFGHYIVSKFFGYKGGAIHYASTTYGHLAAADSLDYYRKKFRKELKNHSYFPEKKLIDKLEEPARIRYSFKAWGGPLQTMLTGTIGLIALILIKRKKQRQQADLTRTEWLWVFITLFWLRQVANCLMMFMLMLIRGKYGNGDETRLSEYYELPLWTLNVITGAIGAFVLYYVIFKFIPLHQRFTFIIAGLVGGVSGYILWLHILGPIVLP